MPRIHFVLFAFVLFAAFLCPQAAPAQDNPGSIAPPLLGFVFETRSAALRPVWGIPGAATLGDPFAFGYPIANAVSAPQLGFALSVSARDGAVRLVPLPNSSVAPVLSTEAMLAPDLIVLSPAGHAAALYKQSTGQLQVISGLPAAPVVASMAAPIALSNPVARLAVADDGSEALLFISAAQDSTLWLVTSKDSAGNDSAGTPLAHGGTAAFAFRPNSHDAVVAMENGDLSLLQIAGTQVQTRQIPAPSSSSITGVQLSADGTRIYVSGASGVAAFDLDSGIWTQTSCACSPQGLYSFGSKDLFRLTDASRGPIFLLDVSGAPNMRIWFVPQDRRPAIPRQSAHE